MQAFTHNILYKLLNSHDRERVLSDSDEQIAVMIGEATHTQMTVPCHPLYALFTSQPK